MLITMLVARFKEREEGSRPLASADLPPLLPPRTMQARFKELEKTRLELDSRRRTVADMSNK